jgi:hypothetical protein
LSSIEYINYQLAITPAQFVRNQQVGGSIPLAGSIGSPLEIGNPPYALPDERGEVCSPEIAIDK